MYTIRTRLTDAIDEIRAAGLYKEERLLSTAQDAEIGLGDGRRVLNLCANNYLGLSNHPVVRQAAQQGLERWGYGLSSVRFICGTQEIHRELERRLAGFLGMEDAILYASAFDANGGLFETLLGPEDAIISDALNHASIIDGVGCARHAGSCSRAVTWRIWSERCRKPPVLERDSWRPTVSSRWTGGSRNSIRSVTWRTSMTRL